MFDHIDGVVFDLDGTLVDSMGIWYEVDCEFLSKRGLAVPANINKLTEGNSFTETAILFKELFHLSETIEEIKKEWILMTLDYYQNKIPLKDGVLDLLEYLKENKIPMAIATSCSRALAQAVIRQHNLEEYFKAIVTSCEVAKGKPHPDVFLKALELMGVEGKNGLAFEDTVAGVEAAKAAGMRVVAVYDKHSEDYVDEIKEKADYFVLSMDEAIDANEMAV
ncbi:HAD family hydrolase [Alkaliphilus serpentinus]|uniref:HAD family phosphatase n=1 Tax=Alkaliphilus serpentinus TaxID=1482731 RepID=A0A833HL72_9FIRM|nr:HAD family phosphatase [Alkaliphilus serpentinus]KAB3525446.1 HAD family phosphatase [Alkaliphilus serpentinus]